MIIILIAVALLTLGYSALAYTLSLGGTAHFRTFWDVHFDNVQVLDGSMTLSQGDTPVTIDPTNSLKVNYSLTFTNVTNYYEFRVDIVNSGTIDGMIDSIVPLINGVSVENLPTYLEYSIAYDDTSEIAEKQLLSAGETETIIFRVGVKDGTDISELSPNSIPFSLEIVYAVADSSAISISRPFLYKVFEDEYNNQSELVLKYTGEHKDSYTDNPSKDIYYWYAQKNSSVGTANANTIKEKWNVLFGDHCWQMLRTTDTGGVKLIYNGEAENNQCLDTRGNHVGYSVTGAVTLSSQYWYGTEYEYDKENSVFRLTGTTFQETWSASTWQNLVGHYTCLSNTEGDGCTTLYYIYDFYLNTKGYSLSIEANSPFNQFGSVKFHKDNSDLGDAGYMSNQHYSHAIESITYFEELAKRYSLSTSYWYADSYSYDSSTGEYSLVDPYKVSGTSQYSSLAGKYTFRNATDTYTASDLYYISSIKSSNFYGIIIKNGNAPSAYNSTYVYSDSFIDNQDGTYTLDSPTTSFTTLDWPNVRSTAVGHYICKNPTNNTCSSMGYMADQDYDGYHYYINSKDYLYGSGFTYENGSYQLTDTVSMWVLSNTDGMNNLKTHHYTCFNTTGTCSPISYVYSFYEASPRYFKLYDGISIETALTNMLSADDVNTNDSTIKAAVEEWYRTHLYSLSDLIEDTIYCGDRSINDIGGFDSKNGDFTQQFKFRSYDKTTGLDCPNETDQFSVSNSKARIKYKVGLITAPEMNLMDSSILHKGDGAGVYWLLTPEYFNDNWPTTYRIDSYGLVKGGNYGTVEGLRPAISLRPGIKYKDGDGSKEHPYIINTD